VAEAGQKKRLAVVTGGMGGLGESISTKMADAGYRVVVTYSPSNTKYKSWLDEMKGKGYSFSAYPVDVVSFEDSTAKCAQIQKDCGQIDILVNNAGIIRDGLLATMDFEQWRQVIETNLHSVYNFCHAVTRPMMSARYGRIVNLSSVAAQVANPGQANYAASKGGVEGFTRCLATELARRNVTVNAVAPGFIETKMTAKVPVLIREFGRRLSSLAQGGLPVDVAETIAWYANPASAAVNGNVVRVCGQSLLGA
jgi:NAD(P)-dependent dehydrogenase (short-subunit alcohol dehydrogenase family)